MTPRITAGDVLEALGTWFDGFVSIHGRPYRVRQDGPTVDLLDETTSDAPAVIWSGRLVAYPAAHRIESGEGLVVLPCPGCGAPVAARTAAVQWRQHCPECALPIVFLEATDDQPARLARDVWFRDPAAGRDPELVRLERARGPDAY